ncbi:MAG: class I SAM-dependent methyltransferase [Caulobacteraceae bacterium]
MNYPLSMKEVRATLQAHLPLYRWRRPAYQWTMLNELYRLWRPKDRKVLDVGGGTGVIAEAIFRLFPVDRVVSIDVAQRFAPGLSIETVAYDGEGLPFADGEFDCVTLNNVLHHVPVGARAGLMRECRRVCGGGVAYIKDHLSASGLDDMRLAALDLAGNLPFSGMVQARYLTDTEWRTLAAESGYEIAERSAAHYRSGPSELLFPNRLEISMRWM